MNNILLFEFDLDGKFLSVYCGMLKDLCFAMAFLDGKTASNRYSRKECRVFKEEFQALENIFTPRRLKFSLFGEVSISCDLKIMPVISGKSHIGLFNFLPRNTRMEFITQLGNFEGEVSVNGKIHNIKSIGYIHRINSKKLPQRFYALNMLSANVCLASYMCDNSILMYNFDSFITTGIIKGRGYKFSDYNFSTISVLDTGTSLIIKLNRGRLELNICAECGVEKLFNYENLAIRANNYTQADIILRFDGKILFKDKAAASLLICGKLKIGKQTEEIKGLCEASAI
ncbi:MAG TPA: hypothetical protein GX745_00210 [Clostridiales bacterium]|jgi:hypothetical protein|nr:hypothetical protein [Clostridiales bacterium]